MVAPNRWRARVGADGDTAPTPANRAHVARNRTLPAAKPLAAAAGGVRGVVRTAAP